jgi:hypothetical protein
MHETLGYTVCGTLALLRLRAGGVVAEVQLRVPGGAQWVPVARASTWRSLHKLNCAGLPLHSVSSGETSLRVTADRWERVSPRAGAFTHSCLDPLPLHTLDLRKLQSFYPGPINWIQVWNDPRMQLVQWFEPAESAVGPVSVRGLSLLRPRSHHTAQPAPPPQQAQPARRRQPSAADDPLGLATLPAAEDPLGLATSGADEDPLGLATMGADADRLGVGTAAAEVDPRGLVEQGRMDPAVRQPGSRSKAGTPPTRRLAPVPQWDGV